MINSTRHDPLIERTRALARARRAVLAAGAAISMLGSTGCVTISWPGASDQSLLRDAQEQMEDWRSATAPSEAERAEPDSFSTKLEAGDALHRRGQHQKALLTYLRAVNMDPDSAVPRRRIGFVQLAHDVERAEAIFSKVLFDHPDDAGAHLGLGLAYLGQGRLNEALESIQTSLDLEPDVASAQHATAIVLSLMSRNEEALQHAKRAIELEPDDATAINALGVTHLLMGDNVIAEKAFHRATLIDSRVTSYRNNLGLALAAQGRFRAALKAFRARGTEQAARNNLGYAYYLSGHYDEAVAEYERALAEGGGDQRAIVRNLMAAVAARDKQTVAKVEEEAAPPAATSKAFDSRLGM